MGDARFSGLGSLVICETMFLRLRFRLVCPTLGATSLNRKRRIPTLLYGGAE